jgi:hypothetical protein
MYKVIVADNYHYMDESESYPLGSYATLEDAIAKCKEIVDEYLLSEYQPAMTTEMLYENYTSFGDDPYIYGENVFSAWTYAKQKCGEICK